jgi:AraC-like DNA-binding protein
MTGATISAGYPKALLEFAVRKGADRRTLLERARLRASDLEAQDNRIPLDGYLALFETGAELTGQPGIALQFGEAVRMQEISIVGLICEACEIAFEVGPALNRYARLVFDGDPAADPALIRAISTEEGLWITQPNEVFARTRYLAEAECARLTWNSRVMFAANPDFQRMMFPRAVSFMHADPGYRDEYERVFGAPVTFGAEKTGILVDPAFMMLKQPPVNRYVFGVLSERAEALLKELEVSTTARGKVESLLMPILHTGEASMDAIACKMAVSRQTLLRKLKAEGVTFDKVLDDLRHRLALHFLSSKKVSVNETAYLVGFSDPAAFSRAFKRWTGKSPRDVRMAADMTRA